VASARSKSFLTLGTKIDATGISIGGGVYMQASTGDIGTKKTELGAFEVSARELS
jgi:hypothetical protein